ncbi:glyoxalase superfamily protein [Paenibacillus koleovorans]|uniref:glyoxalase superfamily protein n=1 Tax=Paenibacillus koleovorans TaxID=121608 RepID=UPI0027D77664|nr:iron-containing alcohol dehydrogenase [Paenibacillus koleovorans]
MPNLLQRAASAAASCECGHHKPVTLETIVVERGALQRVPVYLAAQHHTSVAVVADANTYEASAEKLMHLLAEQGIHAQLVLVKPNEQGDVVADEAALVQVMIEVPHLAVSALLAVGAGTIHDLVRYAAFKMGKSFISVPTAASVDGFNSVGAPLILRGHKTTLPAIAPIALFADLDVLMAAPKRLTAAGFGDMLGKCTSLFDWQFAHRAAGEPYCPAVAQLTQEALDSCLRDVEEIASGSEQGLRTLMEALIQSGLAMMLFGQSHSASGSEHHLSHYWEMEYLRLGRKQLLHGAKVGVASAEIAWLYRSISRPADWPEMDELVEWLPTPEQLREWLAGAGGPTTPQEIGIDEELLKRSLREAHRVRNRYTMLRAYNESRAAEPIVADSSHPTTPAAPDWNGVIPILRSFDESKARAFYVDFLGMQVDFEHRFEPSLPLYMQVSLGEVKLHLSEHHGDCTPGSAVRIEMKGIAQYHASLLAKHYGNARPGLSKTPWGSKEMSIQDPFGNRVILYEWL